MAFLGIKVPSTTASEIKNTVGDLPGQPLDTSEYHLTLVHLGHEVSAEVAARAAMAATRT